MFNSSTFKYIFSNIALYTSLGFPVTDSVELLQKRARISKKYTNLLHRVINLLNEGKSITESFAEMIHMKKYGKILSVLLHTQEQAGSVALGFKSIEECVDKIEHSKQTIIQNFAYPILVLCFACAMIFSLVTYIFPKIISLYTALRAPIPTSTRLLLKFSEFVTHNAVFIVGCALLTYFICLYCYRTSLDICLKIDTGVLKIPYIGTLVFMQESILIADTVAILMRSGLPADEALSIAEANIRNAKIKKEFVLIRNLIHQGVSWSNAMSQSGILYKSYWFDFVSAGEVAGNIAHAMNQIRDVYTAKKERMVSLCMRMAEPVLLLSIASVVLAVALSVTQPMYAILQYVTPK